MNESIKIKIANKDYKISIKTENIEIFLTAEKMINEKITQFKSKFQVSDDRDAMAIVLFNLQLDLLKNSNGNSNDADSIIKIQNLTKEISKIL